MTREGFSMFARAAPSALARTVSRRQFFGLSGGAAGVMFGSGLWTPARGEHHRDDHDDKGERDEVCLALAPEPIPHITIPPPAPCERAHFFFPGPVEGTTAPTDPTGPQPGGRDPSTIFNFDGVLGVADLDLSGTGTNTTTGETARYLFHTDMRFMKGRFLGTDGRIHHGTFVFI